MKNLLLIIALMFTAQFVNAQNTQTTINKDITFAYPFAGDICSTTRDAPALVTYQEDMIQFDCYAQSSFYILGGDITFRSNKNSVYILQEGMTKLVIRTEKRKTARKLKKQLRELKESYSA